MDHPTKMAMPTTYSNSISNGWPISFGNVVPSSPPLAAGWWSEVPALRNFEPVSLRLRVERLAADQDRVARSLMTKTTS